MKINSFKDSKGKLCVDCTECIRGWNGDRSCSGGFRFKRAKQGCCFAGDRLPHINVNDVKQYNP